MKLAQPFEEHGTDLTVEYQMWLMQIQQGRIRRKRPEFSQVIKNIRKEQNGV